MFSSSEGIASQEGGYSQNPLEPGSEEEEKAAQGGYSQNSLESGSEEEEKAEPTFHRPLPQSALTSDCGNDFDRNNRPMKSKIRLERSEALHSGRSYTTSNGKTRRQSQSRPLIDCRMKCAQRLAPETCQALHGELLKLKSSHEKRLYLAPLISVSPKKTEKKSVCDPSQQRTRIESRKYHVVAGAETIQVCKGCFVRIFDLSNPAIDTIVRKKSGNPVGILEEDQRGRHPPPQKLQQETIELIQQHIMSCLAYASDSPQGKTSKSLLPPHLTLKKMYNSYIEKHPQAKVSRWSYERQFHAIVGIQNYMSP